MSNALPTRVPLTGPDFLLLAFDRAMQRASAHGNVCHLVLELEGRLELQALAELVEGSEWLGWLARLRYRAGWPWQLPSWHHDATRPPLELAEANLEDLEQVPSLFRHGLDVRREAPLSLLLVHGPAHDALVVRWHHAVFDAHGMETLISSLGDGTVSAELVCGATPVVSASVPARLLEAKKARDFLWTASKRVSFLAPAIQPPEAELHFRQLVFDRAETVRIDARAREFGALVTRSAFHLAVATDALARVCRARSCSEEMLVPTPLDLRRRGQAGPMLGNRISLLFYRVPLAPTDLRVAVTGLTEQMRGLMRARLPRAYIALLSFCRWLPAAFLLPIVRLPTRGRMATFGFSDTGEVLPDTPELAGRPIQAATHYPANMHPPGITMVFSRHAGRTRICLSWMDGSLMREEADAVLAALREGLLVREA